MAKTQLTQRSLRRSSSLTILCDIAFSRKVCGLLPRRISSKRCETSVSSQSRSTLTIAVQFYASCGSKPISSLVEESLASAGEGNARMAAAVRELVIERLPLFLHDRNGKPTAFKFAWFKSAENFIVRPFSFRSLRVAELRSGRSKQ